MKEKLEREKREGGMGMGLPFACGEYSCIEFITLFNGIFNKIFHFGVKINPLKSMI